MLIGSGCPIQTKQANRALSHFPSVRYRRPTTNHPEPTSGATGGRLNESVQPAGGVRLIHGVHFRPDATAEVSASVTWRRCTVHPTTLIKLTSRCGSTAVDGTTVVPARTRFVRTAFASAALAGSTWSTTRPTQDCWPRRSIGSGPQSNESMPRVARSRTTVRDRSWSAGAKAHGADAKMRADEPDPIRRNRSSLGRSN